MQQITQGMIAQNPYLFKIKNIITAGDFVKIILDAHLSSQEEALFGGFLEGLGIYICRHIYGWNKFKLCGQHFWSFISGNENLYTELIDPLGHKAKEKNEQFFEEYARVVNKFSLEFMEMFCDEEGNILWEQIIQFNSGKA